MLGQIEYAPLIEEHPTMIDYSKKSLELTL